MPAHIPTCTIIAGPNGAGKTTFAQRFLSERQNFINADEIAREISASSSNPEILAGRLFFERVRQHRVRREDFSIETTLSGKAYLRLVSQLLVDGWWVRLFYLWVPGADASIKRVAERVSHGGHDIPREDMIRRYPRSIYNLLYHYVPLCSSAYCLDNSGNVPEVIFKQSGRGAIPVIHNRKTYNLLVKGANDERR